MSRKKLSIEYIRYEFEKEGYKLLTEKYINNTQKLNYICPNNHKYNISWGSWKQGRRCYYCGITKSISKRKESLEFIRSEFAKENYKLLTIEYINCNQKLDYICPKGHKHSISWSNWQQGQRCPYCYGNVRLTINFIRSEFAKEGYTLLTEEYKNAKQKLNYICPEGHKHSITWTNWYAGFRCFYCFGNIKLNIKFIKFEFEKEGYVLLTNQYINSKQKLKYMCPNGHLAEIVWGGWQQGKRCWKCYCIEASLNKLGNKHWNWKGYSEEDLKEISNYKAHVSQLTEQNYRRYRNVINPKDLPRKRNKYHLDHIYSIRDGFINNVEPSILAHPTNLRMLLYRDNIVKSSNSEITLDSLYLRIKEWEKTHEV